MRPFRPGHTRKALTRSVPAARFAVCGLVCVPLWASAAVQGDTPSSPTPLTLALPEAPQPQSAAAAPGSIAGEIVDNDGAMIAGAQITVQTGTASARTAVSDTNGQFVLADVPPGPFSLQVTLQGFTPYTQAGTLQPGQRIDLSQIVLSLAVVSFTVDAVTPEQLALEELHTEEHQRLVGLLPNFFVSYDWTAPPLSARQKFILATHNAADPGNLALVGVVAGVQQATNAFPGYHQGAAGFGKRYGADLANLVVGTYMGGAVLPSLFHQDPRYFYKGTGTPRQRFVYALSRAVITRGDNGHNQPNFAGVLGDLSAAALSNVYYPATDRQGATLFFENGILAIAGDAMNDLVQEFFFNRITTRGKKQKSNGR